jgi:phospholipid/cholesterol/gamma-HCH transport system substrate-binding protein
MKIKGEVKIGLIVAITLAAVIWGFNFLKAKNVFKISTEYHVVYDDVMGLTKSNPVIVSGYKVGNIEKIYFNDHQANDLTVTISLEEDLKIPVNSVAKIISSDILGTKAIKIIFGDEDQYLGNGDTLQGAIEKDLFAQVEEEILPLKNRIESLISSIDTVALSLKEIASADTREDIKTSIDNLAQTSEDVNEIVHSRKNEIKGTLANLESITSNLKKSNDEILAITKNIATISDSVANSNLTYTVNNAANTLAEAHALLESINQGKGTMGKIFSNDSLYYNFVAVTRDLELLLEDLKAHPKRYVHFSLFGKKDK